MTIAQSFTPTSGPRRLHPVDGAAGARTSEIRTVSSRRTLLGYLVMPRPKDLFKALLMPAAFGLAVLATGGTTGHTLLRAVVVLAALELLVYPARYQWNDVRGFAADQRHPSEADRGRLPGPLHRAREHVTASVAVGVARIVLTAALPFLLPGLDLGGILLFVVLGVFGVAAAYETVRAAATGRTGAVPPPVRPALVLLWLTVGAGYVVRGLTGLALVVNLPGDPGLAVAAAVTLWAYGVAFVTARWAIEATAFARLRQGRVLWGAEAAHAREHLLALVRWVPSHVDPAVSSATGWAALRGRTAVLAPWNLAAVVAGAAAAVTGQLLTGPATTTGTLVTGAAGGLAALVTVLAARGRVATIAVGGAVLAGIAVARDAPLAVAAALPWVAVTAAYVRSTGGCLDAMGHTGEQLRTRLGGLFVPVGRALFGRETWNLLRDQGPARG
jgi:hypothetical protein